MKINELRRANLREWVKLNGLPPSEKSYFSQILGGSSFGEKAARRVEQQYKMGEGFLDRTREGHELELRQIPETYIDPHQLATLIDLFSKASRNGRLFILDAAESAETIIVAKPGAAANDQP